MTEEPTVYAISDLHLGLRERGPQGHSDAPSVVAEFLAWLARVPPTGVAIPVEEHGAIGTRVLKPPTDLVLLGDVIELWDGENATIQASVGSVAPSFHQLPARTSYILGNHDNLLAAQSGRYPIGRSGLQILGEVFPEPDPGSKRVKPLRVGDREYVFVHGHQFDRSFQDVGRAWTLLGHLREFGAATGGYAWLFAVVTAFTIAAQWFFSIGIWGWVAIVGTLLVWLPRFYMTVARRLWARLTGSRYDRPAALRGFARWWRGFGPRVDVTVPLSIVYGHTHLLDFVGSAPPTEALRSVRLEERALREGFRTRGTALPTLFNIASWVRARGAHSGVTWATMFYADASGPLFLGWDWVAGRPFHIPSHMIAERWSRDGSNPRSATIGARLGWPPQLVRRWAETPSEVQ